MSSYSSSVKARVLGFVLSGFGAIMLIQLASDLFYPWEESKIRRATGVVFKVEPGTQRWGRGVRHGHYMFYSYEVPPGQTFRGKAFTKREEDRLNGVGRKLSIEYHHDYPAKNRLAGEQSTPQWIIFLLALVYLMLIGVGSLYLYTGRDVFNDWKMARHNEG